MLCMDMFDSSQPGLVIIGKNLVDSPGTHLRLIQIFKRRGIHEEMVREACYSIRYEQTASNRIQYAERPEPYQLDKDVSTRDSALYLTTLSQKANALLIISSILHWDQHLLLE